MLLSRIQSFLGVTPFVAQQIKSTLRNRDLTVEERMEAVNELIGGFGVEFHRSPESAYDAEKAAGITYVNKGDTYDPTICHLRFNDDLPGKFVLSSWGDAVETFEQQTGTKFV